MQYRHRWSMCHIISVTIAVLPVLSHSMHASLLADGRDLGIADLVRPAHVILQVHLLAQIHFCSASLQGKCF